MKLNTLSRALVAAGFAFAATSSFAAYTADPSTSFDTSGNAVALSNGTQSTLTTTVISAPSTSTSTGAVTTSSTVFTTTQTNLGNSTSPTQGTYGGPGGVSYSGSTKVGTKTVVNGTTTTITTSTSAVGTGLAGTDHDFVNKLSGNTMSVGACTFCHTPHKASSTLLLWNHTASSNTFQWDVAATTAGTALPSFTGSYSGPSAKCLACHDGSVAVGDVGWFQEKSRTAAAAATDGGTNGALNTFKMTGAASKLVGASGALNGTHPVAVPYPLNGAPNVYNGSTSGARLATNDFVADPTANNMRLYSDFGGGAIVGKVQPGKTGIECSSCHDPHNKAAVDRYFLRGMFTGAGQASGYICQQCHIK
jgi:hypothetical protein